MCSLPILPCLSTVSTPRASALIFGKTPLRLVIFDPESLPSSVPWPSSLHLLHRKILPGPAGNTSSCTLWGPSPISSPSLCCCKDPPTSLCPASVWALCLNLTSLSAPSKAKSGGLLQPSAPSLNQKLSCYVTQGLQSLSTSFCT